MTRTLRLQQPVTGITVASIAALLSSTSLVSAQSLRVETGTAFGLTTVIPQFMAKHAAKDGLKLQINADQTLTKSTLKLAAGQLDLSVTPPPAYRAMLAGRGPYARGAEQAKKLGPNLRSLFGFVAGYFHTVVWADSNLKSYADLKGKRVFIGPPAGAANRQINGLIALASDLKPDKDFTAVKLGWGAGIQAFQDGQVDVLIQPAPLGSAAIEQIGLQRKIRVISLTKGSRQGPKWDEFERTIGSFEGDIPPKTYSGQVNNDENIETVAYSMQITVNKKMTDDMAYKLTKSFWDNIKEAKRSVAMLKLMSEEDPFIGMNVPLHPGAVKYFTEKGFKIPAKLQPKS
jgi:TRAP transporter TAXI family solute receptor